VVHTFVFQPIVNRKVFCVFVAGGAVATAAEAANAAAVGRPAAATTIAGRMVHRTQTSAKSKRSSRSGNTSSSHTVVKFLNRHRVSVIKKVLLLVVQEKEKYENYFCIIEQIYVNISILLNVEGASIMLA